MWKFGVLVIPILLATSTNGQEQYLREVKNPTGPSQIVIRGGFLGNSQTPDKVEIVPQQPEVQNTLSDPPQQVGLPLQANLDSQPIPQNGNGADNPFTNGDSGFGLRLSQPGAPSAQQQQQNAPDIVQQQQRQGVTQFFHQQVVPQQQFVQPAPVLQQPLTLPQLPDGQHYVDAFGRPIVFTQPQVQVAQPQAQVAQPQAQVAQPQAQVAQPQAQVAQPQPTAPPTNPPIPPPPAGHQYVDVFGRPIVFSQPQLQVAQPQAQVQVTQPQPTAPPTNPPPPVEKQALVDQYGRQLAEIQVQQAPQVIQTPGSPVPVAQTHVIQQLEQPIVNSVIKQQVLQNVIQQTPVLQKVVAPAPLALKHYAVPAVSKVGNLEIPYAQKVTVTSDKEVVFPPVVPAAAIVKSKHRTVFSPVKVVAQSAPPAPIVTQAHPQVPAATQIVEEQHHVIQPVAHVVEEQHHVVQPVAHVVEQQHHVVQPVAHVVEQQHHIVQPGPQIVQHHAVQPVAQVVEQQHHVVQPVAHVVEQQHHVVQPVTHVVEHHHHVPEYTVIHQPVLSKPLFQKHIFDVKHGSTPLIYQDLCTVYPYQKNLRACVLKKAALPALHHPDIRTVRVEDQPQPNQSLLTDNTIVAGGSSIVAPLPPSPSPSPQSDSSPTVAVTKMLPQNIQDAIRRQKSKAAAQAVAETGTSTTVQPETAESRTDASTTEKSRRRRKGSSSRKGDENREFKLV